VLGVGIRAWLVVSRDFPLNDGGMFYLMADEIGRAHFRLPMFTAYNAANIPFAYSPLSFYLAAGLAALTPLSLVDTFRLIPFVCTSLTVWAFVLLARPFLQSRVTLAAAVVAFATVPRSFMWLIMGGGLSRSLGFLFAMLAIHQAHLMYTRRKREDVALTTLWCALTLLSHLGTAPFAAFSIALFFLFYGRHRFGVVASVIVIVGALALSAPWWGLILARHGIGPFLAANATGGSIFSDNGTRTQVLSELAHFGVGTAEPLFPIIGTLALLGVIVSLTPQRVILPLWWLEIVTLDARAGSTYSTIPVSMLAAIAFTEVLIPLLRRPWEGSGSRMPLLQRWLPVAVSVVVAGYCTLSAVMRDPGVATEGRYLNSLGPVERGAMEWVARSTPSDARFLVVTGSVTGGWYADRTQEWFPVLARRKSVATPQGLEWLPGRVFERMEEKYDDVQLGCVRQDPLPSCLARWSGQTGITFDHIYIPKIPRQPCCAGIRESLASDSTWRELYDGPGAAVFVRASGVVASR
jgi:hypothetical protein